MQVRISVPPSAVLAAGAVAGLAVLTALRPGEAGKLSSLIDASAALTGLILTLADRSDHPPSQRRQGPPARGDVMHPGETLPPGWSVFSASGACRFTYQTDGNLVLYRTCDDHALWDSKTAGATAGVCFMQHDGNLVIYDAEDLVRFHSGTHGNPGSRLFVQDDGNVVIRRSDDTPIWDTLHHPVLDTRHR